MAGYKIASNAAEADRLKAVEDAQIKYAAEVERGNYLSGKLAAAESSIQVKIVERIKYVPQVTTGKDCLSAAAVGLINGLPDTPGKSGSPTDTRQLATESPGTPSATDSDVEQWIIGSQGQYDTCATRLNALIDLVEEKSAD